jgi:soluble lytic murein transglycosylase-like protein
MMAFLYGMVGRMVVATVSAAATATLLGATSASAYEVGAGETLSSISSRTGVPVSQLASDNQIANPDRVYAGRQIRIRSQRAAAEPRPAAAGVVRGEQAKRLLVAAARERQLNPNFVLALSLWESGYNQSMVSGAGAVGLMQILPVTAEWAGPALLGRRVDITNASDNARLGAALLRHYLDEFHDPKLALAAYYQGPTATHRKGIYPSSRQYVDGVWRLRNLLQASTK